MIKKIEGYLIIGIVALFLVHPLFAGLVISPTIPNQQNLEKLVIIQGNSVKTINISTFEKTRLYGANLGEKEGFKELIRKKYPEMVDLLFCLWEKESSFGKNMIGDRGKAIGHFQIWISIHNISEECAMDFECSLEWVAQKVREGKGYLWTTYKPCLTEISNTL